MTTAHRPTFDPARGKEALRGPAYHQRLQPAHTHLKLRQAGQGGAAEARPRDLRAELLAAEAAVRARKNGSGGVATDEAGADDLGAGTGEKRKGITAPADGDDVNADDEDSESKRRRMILEQAAELDADEESDEEDDEDGDESSEEDSDDEDEAAALQRELAKIKAEKAAKKAAEEAERAREDEERREVEIARGNPLLNKPDFGVKRRWDDDVVFKNQARGTEEKGRNREFVNDLLRSDFHKKFMSRYVR